jgi:hypothetical protein
MAAISRQRFRYSPPSFLFFYCANLKLIFPSCL